MRVPLNERGQQRLGPTLKAAHPSCVAIVAYEPRSCGRDLRGCPNSRGQIVCVCNVPRELWCLFVIVGGEEAVKPVREHVFL